MAKKLYKIEDIDVIENALKNAYILYISNVDKELTKEVDLGQSFGRSKYRHGFHTSVEFPTLNMDYFIIREYWHTLVGGSTFGGAGRYTETIFKDGKPGQTSGWEIVEIYCGSKNGPKKKTKKRIF
jgi:hypothetical protein